MISKEDKKILESYVRDFDERNKYGVAFREDLLKLAIENVLSDIQQLETEEQKVIDTLEELKKEYKEVLENNSTKAFILKCQIEILEEIEEE